MLLPAERTKKRFTWLDGVLMFDSVDEVPMLTDLGSGVGIFPTTGLPWKSGMQTTFNWPDGVDAWSVWGNFVNAVAAADTTLETEITDSGLARVAATVTRVTTSTTNDTVQMVTTFTVTGTKTIKEVGILNASSTGDLGGRTVLTTPKDVVNGSSYTVTYKTIFARE